MSFTNASERITYENQRLLLREARKSIEYGIEHNKRRAIDASTYPNQVQQIAASFVSLHIQNNLRGCIGSLAATQALIIDVVQHAYASAFQDTRFTSVTMEELSKIDIEISVLTPQQQISCRDQNELLEQLTAGEDGLTIEDGGRRATFLPSVWKQLPEKNTFLRRLKNKAGMDENHWSNSFRAYTYRSVCFTDTN